MPKDVTQPAAVSRETSEHYAGEKIATAGIW
jgi:hypothetical protein